MELQNRREDRQAAGRQCPLVTIQSKTVLNSDSANLNLVLN